MGKDFYYFVEANMRTTGTSYPREFVKKVNGDLKNIHYQAGDVNLSEFTKISLEKVLSVLNPITFNKSKNSGLLIYNTGGINYSGRFDIISVGKNENEVVEILDKTKSLLKKYFRFKSSF